MFTGESVIGDAGNVLKFAPYSDGKQGISGVLYCTNYKLTFVTADRSSYKMVSINYTYRAIIDVTWSSLTCPQYISNLRITLGK